MEAETRLHPQNRDFAWLDPQGPFQLLTGIHCRVLVIDAHRTDPNVTDETRKCYILQYASEGAVMYPRDKQPSGADNPEWQYLVLQRGTPSE